MSVTCVTSRATKRSSWPRVADAAVYYALSVSFLSHCLTHTASTESTAVSHLVLLSAQQMNSYIRTQGGSAECSGLTNAYGLDSIYVGGKKLIHICITHASLHSVWITLVLTNQDYLLQIIATNLLVVLKLILGCTDIVKC